MASLSEWRITPARQPKPGDYRYDLDQALASVVGIRALVPDGAFTAETLGTERAGSGVVISDGVVLTIGYLITEAEEIWISAGDGRSIAGHPLGYDQVTGFGLVQALGSLGLPVMALGRSQAAQPGTPVVIGATGGRKHSIASFIVGKQEFAGYWEYLLDEAVFTAPAHPSWGGGALIGADGKLLGIGSLMLQMARDGEVADINMVVPINLLPPILDDLLTRGQVNTPPRPWLGVFSAESDGTVVVMSVAKGGPAAKAGLRRGDIISDIGDTEVDGLADFYRKVWGLGSAGSEVPMRIVRDGRDSWVRIKSADRNSFLKKPQLQ